MESCNNLACVSHCVGGRVTDGVGSSVAAEWPDRARTVALQPLPGWCGCVYKPGWLAMRPPRKARPFFIIKLLWPLRMAKRVSKERHEMRRKAEHGGTGTSHSRSAPGTIRAMSAERDFFWFHSILAGMGI